jgi:hypothetical protein
MGDRTADHNWARPRTEAPGPVLNPAKCFQLKCRMMETHVREWRWGRQLLHLR